MDLGLKKKVVFVTGGSNGIGKAVAERFAQEGADVAICARTESQLVETTVRLRAYDGDVEGFVIDGNDSNSVCDGVTRVLERFQHIDVLVNNAGGDGLIKPILDLSDKDWLRDLNQNFLISTRFDRAVAGQMCNKRQGRIVHIASVAGIKPDPAYAPYCAAKSALISYSMAMARYLAPFDILCNSVLPGIVDTRQMTSVAERMAQIGGLTAADVRRRFEENIPLQRYADANEVADVILFLCSARSSYMTGTTLIVDGGMLASLF